MDWRQLDVATRAGVVATAIAVLGVLIPPISVLGALVAIACSGLALRRARGREQSNVVAWTCLGIAVVLVAAIVLGSAVYGAGS